jgi:hypothetical protein
MKVLYNLFHPSIIARKMFWMMKNFYPIILFVSIAQTLMQAISETLGWFNQVYSMLWLTKSLEYLYQMVIGENRAGTKQRENETETKRVAD